MARNRGCCRRAKSALTSDCSPVRLPNWVEGYLPGQQRTCHHRCHSQAFQMPLSPRLAPGVLGPPGSMSGARAEAGAT